VFIPHSIDGLLSLQVRADFVHRQNIEMIECWSHVRFLLEVAPPIWVIRKRSGQYFESDPAPEPRVYGQLDFAQPAGAER
jgi:hypothetical protein